MALNCLPHRLQTFPGCVCTCVSVFVCRFVDFVIRKEVKTARLFSWNDTKMLIDLHNIGGSIISVSVLKFLAMTLSYHSE